MTQQQEDVRVDELRRQLRSLGYLDAGVDRFVLGPARSARSPWAIAALLSLRVGFIAAASLAPATAIGIGARLPGLVNGPRDAVILALYLAAIFWFAATSLTFLASIGLARFGGQAFATRARYVSRGAGTAVGLAALAYLTLWWGSTNVEAWSSPIWTAVALLIAVVVSLLIGHAVAITAFAVLAARYPEETATTRPAASTKRLVIVAGMFAFAGAAALLFVTASRQSPRADAPRLAVVSPGVQLVVFAIDGFDPKTFDSLRASGSVPSLERLTARGTARIVSDDTRDPARAWTTIATSQPPEVHGVRSLETRRVAGMTGALAAGRETGVLQTIRAATDLFWLTRPSIVSGTALRAKTFWEVAAEAGLRTVVVNWWATWPAAGTGANAPVILSDRATLRLERGGALDAEIAPKELYEPLLSAWTGTKQDATQIVNELLPRAADATIDAVIRRSAELDALQFSLSARLAKRVPARPDLFAMYLPGLDIAQHTLLGDGGNASASALSARLDAIRAYYVYLDKLIGELLVGEKDVAVMLVMQPGRLASSPHGLLAVDGRIAAPSVSGDMRAVDIAPTVLHALGVPISRELAGRPAMGLFAADFVARFPVREVATYGERQADAAVREGQPLDEEMVERLRSLGYVR